MSPVLLWGGFFIFVAVMLCLDLFVFHKNAHEVKFKEAMWFSVFWIGLALLFNAGVYFYLGHQKGLEFLTGYVIEKSLSVDNLFVFIMLFSYFQVSGKYQHKILFWGIMGAIVIRGIFIFAGVALIQQFSWIIYVFGAFLIITGIKMAFQQDEEIHPENNPAIKLIQKIMPITHDHQDGKFFLKKDGRWMATTLFVVLVTVETTDIVFAVDSIPAILAISHDPFIVFTSNIFAILGLRALYFALSGMMQMFHYLKYGLSAILVFVGAKMIAAHFFKIPIAFALGVIAFILAISILASYLFPKKDPPPVHLAE